MYAIHYFWLMQPMEIKLTVLGLLMIVLVSAVRFVGLAWRIYHEPRGVIGPEDVSRGAVDPDLLARSALANRVPWQGILAKLADTRPSAESAGGDQSAPVYRMAESAFLCLWKKCQADVEAGKRASNRLTANIRRRAPCPSIAHRNTPTRSFGAPASAQAHLRPSTAPHTTTNPTPAL